MYTRLSNSVQEISVKNLCLKIFPLQAIFNLIFSPLMLSACKLFVTALFMYTIIQLSIFLEIIRGTPLPLISAAEPTCSRFHSLNPFLHFSRPTSGPSRSPTPARHPPPRNRPSTRPDPPAQRPNIPDRNEINQQVQNAQTAYSAYSMASSVGITPPIPNRPDSGTIPSIPK